MSLSSISRRIIQKLKSVNRNLGQKCIPKQSKKFNLAEACFNLSGFNKYGLYSDDMLYHEDPDVKEAIERLPKDVYDAKTYRGIRAMHLSLLKAYLPKEQWITYEQDLKNRYLQPYIKEVKAEKQEIRDFGCTNYKGI